MNLNLKTPLFLLFAIVFFAATIQAHEPNHSYIFLKIYEQSIEGRLEITASDLNRELDLNLNEELVEQEVMAAASNIQQYLQSKITFGASGSNYQLQFTETELLPLDDEADNIVFYFKLGGVSEIPDNLDIAYGPFFDKKDDHKGVLIVEHNWKAGIIDNHLQVSEIFTDGNTRKELSLTDASIWNGFWAMTKLGMWHIWIGLDHILFLVALILPAVVRRNEEEGIDIPVGGWIPVPAFKPAFLYLLGIVSSFTVAHSVTLAIAAFGIVDLPSKYVESIIAFSIALAAVHNIKPIFKSKEWIVTFAFGLFHGFGFASVLGEKGLAGEFVSLSLLGFNVGVEIGQVLIVSGIFPILYLLRKTAFYPKFITYGSVVLILISLQWVIERLFEVNIRLGSFLDSFL